MTCPAETSTDQLIAQAKAVLSLIVSDGRDGEFTIDAESIANAALLAHDLIAEAERRL